MNIKSWSRKERNIRLRPVPVADSLSFKMGGISSRNQNAVHMDVMLSLSAFIYKR